MNFSRDNINYEVDVFHVIVCYTMLLEVRYSPDYQGYPFLCFANMRKGGASTNITNVMKNCVGKVEGYLMLLQTSSSWNNKVMQRMIDVRKHFDINLKILKGWSASVKKDLNTRITCTTQSVDDVCK
eukprot:10981809-Ditylum_brightwellii.AAC.1